MEYKFTATPTVDMAEGTVSVDLKKEVRTLHGESVAELTRVEVQTREEAISQGLQALGWRPPVNLRKKSLKRMVLAELIYTVAGRNEAAAEELRERYRVLEQGILEAHAQTKALADTRDLFRHALCTAWAAIEASDEELAEAGMTREDMLAMARSFHDKLVAAGEINETN